MAPEVPEMVLLGEGEPPYVPLLLPLPLPPIEPVDAAVPFDPPTTAGAGVAADEAVTTLVIKEEPKDEAGMSSLVVLLSEEVHAPEDSVAQLEDAEPDAE